MSTTIRKTTITSGPISETKTYTTESKTSYESTGPEGGIRYTPTLKGRTTIIQRSAYGGPSISTQRSVSYGMGVGMPVAVGSYSTVTTHGVQNVKQSRDKEKRDMQDLNERFASYIEKVRFLEAQNRKLADELDRLKSKWGKETTAIKAMYQAELDEARRLLDDAEKEKARLEIRTSSLEEQIEELRQQLEELREARIKDRETIERQNQQLSEYEAEINVLRRRIEQLENDRDRDKKEIARLTEALNRARVDLDNETLAHIDAENRRQTLEEELEFLKQVHEQEMKELAALAYRDTTAENREFWKNELGNALREIQMTYDEKLEVMRGELEQYYNLKLQEFRTGATRQNMDTVHAKEEAKRLRQQLTDMRAKLADLEARNAQLEKELELLRREYEEKEREWEAENTELKNDVAKLRAELEAILKELQDLMDTKLGLELEIAAYRKLLEGEENRFGLTYSGGMESSSSSSRGGLKEYGSGGSSGGIEKIERVYSASHTYSAPPPSESIIKSEEFKQDFSEPSNDPDSSLKVSQVVKGEMSAKTTYQRSAKGPVSIMECAANGDYIALENTSRKTEDLSNWRITRVIDGTLKHDFNLGDNFKLNGKVKLYAKGRKPGNAGPNDIEVRVDSWGIGANINTKLINQNGEDRATHIQKTIYTS